MTERERTNAYETIGCALAVLERVRGRELGDLSVQIRKAVHALIDIQCDLHRAAGPLKDGGRVPRKLKDR